MNRATQYLDSLSDPAQAEIAQLVDMMIQDAIDAGSSDIQLEPWDTSLAVRVRLNGVLQELLHLPLELSEKLSGRLKVMANLISYESDRPQEGHAQMDTTSGGVELRMSFFPVVRGSLQGSVLRGEKIVIRIFDPNKRSFNLDDLGLEADTLASLKQLLSKPSGMILLTEETNKSGN